MLKLHTNHTAGTFWLPVDKQYDIENDKISINISSTLRGYDKTEDFNVVRNSDNYIIVNFTPETFSGCHEGEYVLSWNNIKWLMQIGDYYTTKPLSSIKVITEDNKEIKCFE